MLILILILITSTNNNNNNNNNTNANTTTGDLVDKVDGVGVDLAFCSFLEVLDGLGRTATRCCLHGR